jgi:hypothetical protein
MQLYNPFDHSIFTVQADSIQITRARCDILDESGTEIFWAILIGFLAGVKIRVYAGESRRTEILRIDRPKEFGPMAERYDYPVIDFTNESRVGTVRLPEGSWKLKPSEKIYDFSLEHLKRIAMDGWILFNHQHEKVGYFKAVPESEDNCKQSVWDVYAGDDRVCQVSRVPERGFEKSLRITADCSIDVYGKLDRRLVLSSILVRMALEVEGMNQG